jgi:hypothetical protein
MNKSQLPTPRSSKKLRSVVRESLAVLLWTYVVLNLLVIDIDRLIIDHLAPSLHSIWALKVVGVLTVLSVVALGVGGKRFLPSVLYIAAYPIVVLFWRLPVFAFRRWALTIALAPVIYRAVSKFRASLLWYTLAVWSGLIILLGSDKRAIVPAMLGMALFLSVHLLRGFRNSYSASTAASMCSFFGKVKHYIEQGKLDSARAAPTNRDSRPDLAEPQDPSTLYLLSSVADIVIDKIARVAKSRVYDSYLIASWLYTLAVTSFAFALQFLALEKIDRFSFNVVAEGASFWGFLGFSLGNLLPARAFSGIMPISKFAVLLSYCEEACAVLIFVILVFTVLTAARESYRADMSTLASEIDGIAKAIDGRVTDVYRMTLAEVEQFLLRDKAALVNGLRKARGLPELSVLTSKPPATAPASMNAAANLKVS